MRFHHLQRHLLKHKAAPFTVVQASRSFCARPDAGPTLTQYVHTKEATTEPILKPDLASFKRQLSLDEPMHGLPVLKPASQLKAPQTETTVLPNGLRVISQETYGQATTIGLFVDAGSRHETNDTTGITHMMEHLGFKSSTTRSHADLVREFETIGAQTTASSGREQIIYTIDVLRDNVDRALELLADSILNPALIPDEIELTKYIMKIQSEDLAENPQTLLLERIHSAAYGAHATLGRPLQCPEDKVDALNLETVRAYLRKFFVAPRMVLAGSGIEHSVLVEKAAALFGSVPPATETVSVDNSVYTGGLVTIEKDDMPFSYAALAFPTGGWHDKDLVPVCVLHTLLGGGDSFSAGGPGKGMYSRLYTHVLNRYYWVESALAFSSLHSDNGLLGIYGACMPEHTSQLVGLLVNQMLAVAMNGVDETELSRAKNQLKSSVLMNLESRMILYEDIGRQLLTYGIRESPDVICGKIDAVTKEDLQRVVFTAMQQKPSLVYCGKINEFPEYDQVAHAIDQVFKAYK
ncbi:hypothetical protein SDRG_10928 [Saprolegnia diclina VS20]|uniref:Alpha-MPP n=1 Tax=Saprolegnia diclina (strain VS20) TaxID=1156394 RepID=T0Q9K0_SAPDV|nr:hypothetical protein SDRG_10928 [Saprolegnia diclina VS20]EQC31326.1 hypothetical protein SDRG_10928 [Saprolegnia diclina VS20]|eukprot:XP_008615167.1 hypothetical protein SDRG_10928 [Saprolegnia diclina VS20]